MTPHPRRDNPYPSTKQLGTIIMAIHTKSTRSALLLGTAIAALTITNFAHAQINDTDGYGGNSPADCTTAPISGAEAF